MSQQAQRGSAAHVLVDINTQCDFLLQKGAVPVSNRTAVVESVRKLMNWARLSRMPVISTLDCHRPGESLYGLPPYCMDRSPGQKKLPFTLLPKRVVLYGDNTLDVPNDPFRRFRQVIVTKRNRDFLSNPKADRLINALDCEYFVLFGMIAEHCVKAAALGLMARQRRVAVVTDACGYWSRTEASLALCQIEAKGAVLVTTEEMISGVAEARLKAAAPPQFADNEVEDDVVDGIIHELHDDDPTREDLEYRGRRPLISDKRRHDGKRSCGVAHRRDVPSTGHPPTGGNGHANGNGNGNGSNGARSKPHSPQSDAPVEKASPIDATPRRTPSRKRRH